MITYPRICDSCSHSYLNRSSFCNHKKKCPEYTAQIIIEKEIKQETLKVKKKMPTLTQNTINKNIVNNTDNSVNNTVVINVQGGLSGLSETLVPILKGSSLSAKEIQCVEQVLLMLRNEGVTTPQELKTLIDEKSVTIQQLAKDIKNCSDQECDDAIEFGASEIAKVPKKSKQSKQEKHRLSDLHLRHSVANLFQNLVLRTDGEDLHVTSDSLATNPLYLSREGLSVWSQNSGIKEDNNPEMRFGKADKEQLCSWLLVQEDRLWRTLIMDILISRLQEFLIEEHTGHLQKVKTFEVNDPAAFLIMKSTTNHDDDHDDDDDEHYIGGYRYEGKYSNLMNRIRGYKNDGIGKEAFVTPIIEDLKKQLSETCKQTSQKGWYHLTKKLSQQEQAEQHLVEGVERLRIAK